MRLKDAHIDSEMIPLGKAAEIWGGPVYLMNSWVHGGKIPGAQFYGKGGGIYISVAWLEKLAAEFGWVVKEEGGTVADTDDKDQPDPAR